MNDREAQQERIGEYRWERARTIAEMDRAFLRHEKFLGRLERYCGKTARLFDSKTFDPYDSDKIWRGLEGVISRATPIYSMSPYVLTYYQSDVDRWREHYIVIEKIRSMKKEAGTLVIDTEWVHSAGV